MKEERNEIMEIDLVYLWVDGNDPTWRAKHNVAVGRTESDASTDGKGRYADNDELKYSLRAVEKYAPWIRRIFIITDSQTPSWLDTSNPKIKIIDHKEVISEKYLPCFNSTVLEHFICNVPGLSEYFLYSNDDMFINRPVSPSDFFTSEGLPIMRMTRRPFRKLLLKLREKVLGRAMSNYNRIVHNAAMLVEERCGKYVNGKAHHNIDAYRKSDFMECREYFAEELRPTYGNHVRKDNDIQRSLYYYYASLKKRGKIKYVTRRTSFRLHTHNHSHYEKLEKSNPMLFCVNDSEFASDADREKARLFLQNRFPEKSRFEK